MAERTDFFPQDPCVRFLTQLPLQPAYRDAREYYRIYLARFEIRSCSSSTSSQSSDLGGHTAAGGTEHDVDCQWCQLLSRISMKNGCLCGQSGRYGDLFVQCGHLQLDEHIPHHHHSHVGERESETHRQLRKFRCESRTVRCASRVS